MVRGSLIAIELSWKQGRRKSRTLMFMEEALNTEPYAGIPYAGMLGLNTKLLSKSIHVIHVISGYMEI